MTDVCEASKHTTGIWFRLTTKALSVFEVWNIFVDILSRTSQRAHLRVVGMLRSMFGRKQPRLPTPFYSFLVPISVVLALSTVFHSIDTVDISPFSDSVLPI